MPQIGTNERTRRLNAVRGILRAFLPAQDVNMVAFMVVRAIEEDEGVPDIAPANDEPLTAA